MISTKLTSILQIARTPKSSGTRILASNMFVTGVTNLAATSEKSDHPIDFCITVFFPSFIYGNKNSFISVSHFIGKSEDKQKRKNRHRRKQV